MFRLIRSIVASVAVAALCVSSASAQTSDDSVARIRAAVSPGQTITVTDGNDRSLSGVLLAASNERLRLRTSSGVREVAVQEVAEVQRKGDSPWNGFLIGAVLGAAVGFSTYEDCQPMPPMTTCGGNLTNSRGMETAAAAALFGAVGLTVDVFLQGSTTVFRRETRRATVGVGAFGGRVGGQLALRF